MKLRFSVPALILTCLPVLGQFNVSLQSSAFASGSVIGTVTYNGTAASQGIVDVDNRGTITYQNAPNTPNLTSASNSVTASQTGGLLATASASADLASGTISAYTSGSGAGAVPSVKTSWSDTLTFHIPNASSTTITNIPVSFKVTGSVLSEGSGYQFIRTSGMTFGNGIISGGYATPNPQDQGSISQNQGWVSMQVVSQTADLFEVQGVYALSGPNPMVQVSASVDFQVSVGMANLTAIFGMSLPAGVTYTSSSGVFLSQPPYSYYFSQLAFAGGFQSTLTYINYSPATVTCVTNFYSNSGAPLAVPFSQGTISTRTDVLPPGGSIHDPTTASLSATGAEGWAKASCTGPVQAGLLYRFYNSSGTPAGEASVNAETAPTNEFATFAQATAASSTGIAYANPSTTQPASITITAYTESGTSLGSQVVSLGPLQHGAANVGSAPLGFPAFTGSVEITSTVPIISLSLNAEAFPVFSSLPPGDLQGGTPIVASGASATSPGSYSYYFSQLAFAGGFQSTLTYINYSPATVTCVTNFYSNTGAPLAVPFSQGTISTRTDVLPPGGSIHDPTTASLSASGAEGWAQASCTGPVEAGLLYRFYDSSGVPAGEASVNAETAPTAEFATFAQATAASSTGIAYANPSATQSASITITAYTASGTSLGSQVVTLGPLQHGAANVGSAPLGFPNFTGFVKITSTIPIISLSLNAEAFPVFSSLPPGDLPSGTPLVTP